MVPISHASDGTLLIYLVGIGKETLETDGLIEMFLRRVVDIVTVAVLHQVCP